MSDFKRFLLLVCFAASLFNVQAASKYTNETKPYEFGFNIEGEQHRHEKKDENGIIMGEFGFITADGVYHVTVYATDENGNFKILSMKNIRVKPYPTASSGSEVRKGHSLSPTPSQVRTPISQSQVNSAIPQSQVQSTIPQSRGQSTIPQSIVQTSSPQSYKSQVQKLVPNIPKIDTNFVPSRSCSHCSLPTTTRRPDPQANIQNEIYSPPTNTFVPNDITSNQRVIGNNEANIPQYNNDNRQYNNNNRQYNNNNRQYNNDNVGNNNILRNKNFYLNNSKSSLGVNLQNYNNPNSGINQVQGPTINQDYNQNSMTLGARKQTNTQQLNSYGNPANDINNFYNDNKPTKIDLNNKEIYANVPNSDTNQNTPQNAFSNQGSYYQGDNPSGERSPKELVVRNQQESNNNPNGPATNYLGSSGLNKPIKPMLISAQMQIVDRNTDINYKGPGEKDGLPKGITKGDMENLLYTFNYTLAFHGHYEEGYTSGAKQGYYFVTGRNGVRTRIDYVADEKGFRPKITQEVLDLLSEDVPKPETEKDEKYGLRGYEFKWLYFPVGSNSEAKSQ